MFKVEAEAIHSQLVQLKDDSGLTLKEISHKSGVPYSTVQRIFAADDPHCSMVYILAITRALGGEIWL